MNTWQQSIKQVIVLFAVALIGFVMHLLFIQLFSLNIGHNSVLMAYATNAILAGLILTALMRLPNRLQGSLGFLYLGGSLVKFAVYFVFFYPIYKEDGELSKAEFATFFVPYVLCLVVETTVLVRKLNRQP